MEMVLREATPGLRRRAASYVRHMWAWVLELNGVRADAAYIEDLVQDVLVDTLLGTRAWNPSRCSLGWHVLGAIDSRIGHELHRAKDRPHFSLEVLDETLAAAVEDALAAANPASNAEDALMATWVLAKLRELAAGDREVLVLLDAICAGIVERADVMYATGMSLREYDAARNRMDRLVEELPHSAVPRASARLGRDARQSRQAA
jgi:DNA-directed RNA polymerase specialized sigma24 family protein